MLSLILALLYPLAIQYERGGFWYALLPVAAVALVTDVVANYTELALIYGLPEAGEYTFSQRLSRLSALPGWRGGLAKVCIDYTNFFDPQHDHVIL